MNGPRRLTPCREERAETACNPCLLGATDDELGEFLDVSPRTVDDRVNAPPAIATAARKRRAAAYAVAGQRRPIELQALLASKSRYPRQRHPIIPVGLFAAALARQRHARGHPARAGLIAPDGSRKTALRFRKFR